MCSSWSGAWSKALEGNGKCFHKLLWALNRAQDKTRSLVKDKKKIERRDDWGDISQCVCLGFSGFHGKLLGNEGFSVHREHGIGILVVVLHYFARFSVEPWGWALSVSSGVHAVSSGVSGTAGKSAGKGKKERAMGALAAARSGWRSAGRSSPSAVGCPHVLPGKQGVWGKLFKAEIITSRTWSCMFPWHNFPWRSRELRVSRESDSLEFS